MKLIDDFGVVLRRAWSIRLSLLSAVFAGLETISSLLPALPLPPRLMIALSAACAVGAALSRVVAQPKMRKPRGRAD